MNFDDLLALFLLIFLLLIMAVIINNQTNGRLYYHTIGIFIFRIKQWRLKILNKKLSKTIGALERIENVQKLGSVTISLSTFKMWLLYQTYVQRNNRLGRKMYENLLSKKGGKNLFLDFSNEEE